MCDTSLVSSLFAVDTRSARIAEHFPEAVRAISVITVGEMRKGAARAGWGGRRLEALDAHLQTYSVLPVDRAVAEEWARLSVVCLERGKQKSDNDLWVAATASRHRLILASLDRDQQDIPGLRVIGEDGIERTVPE